VSATATEQVTGEHLLAVADRIIDHTRNGEEVEVVVAHDVETEIRAYDGDVESLTVATSQGVGIRVVVDGRQGFAWAGSLDQTVIDEALAEARDNATFATPDEWVGLAAPDGVTPAELDLWSDELLAFAPDAKVALALELERVARGADPRIAGIESADYVDFASRAAIVSTAGIRSVSADSGCYLSASTLATDGEETTTGFGYSLARDPHALSVEVAAREAADRATRLLGAVKPPSGRLTVVLDPWVTAQFLGILGHTLNGEAVLKGRSLFADRLGEEVASPLLTLIDDPTDREAFSATAVDGEGLATRRNVLLEAGVLRMFVHNAYTARRAGTRSTGSAVRSGFRSTPGVGCAALRLVPGDRSQAELLAGVDDGILVQDVAGLHSGVNPVSGDFSTGAEGLRITDGTLGEPLREFTIASTLQRMLTDVTAVGNDLQWLPMSAAGVTLVIDDITVSGT